MVLELEASSAQVQRILQSNVFRTSEVHRNLLNYLAEKSLGGEADGLKEYTIGLDVFAKPSSYDPRQESTVRMHVGRLRQKLAEYYRTEGAADPIIVDVPKGGFRVTFEPRPEAPAPSEPAAVPARPRIHYWLEAGLAAGLVVAAAAALYFGTRLSQVRQETVQAPLPVTWTPELQALWDPLVSENRPLIVAVSTASPEMTSSATASGVYRLGEFLGARHANVQVLGSDQIEAPEVAMGNVVFFGPVTQNRQMQAMSEGRPLVLEAGGIRNLDPLPGEPEFLADRLPSDPQDTEESYALVSRVPGLYGGGEILYLSGNRISSITGGVQAFTDKEFARRLVAEMRDSAGNLPRYYQVVLKVRSMDDMLIDVKYVLHRELTVGAAGSFSK